MRKFRPRGDVVTSHLSGYEVGLLTSLVSEIVEIVADGEPERYLRTPAVDSADPFDQLAAELDRDPGGEPEDIPDESDPVLQRLLPNAYPHDPAAAHDFRRFTEHGLRSSKIADAQVVLADLARTDEGALPVEIGADQVGPWLRTLTSVRLAVATRLGITDAESADRLAELPDEDPRAFTVTVYDWLGFAQETLVEAL